MKVVVETKLPAGEIIDIKRMFDGTWVIKQEVEVKDKVAPKKVSFIPEIVIPEILFRRVEAESLSLDDEFIKHSPKTEREEKAKALITEAIAKGVKNFYCPIMDPAFTKTGENICFEKGRMPAVGKSYTWWKKVAEKFNPERNSRLGTRLEYGAFLGVLIKELVADEASSLWAWNAVCNDSEKLGHYWNSKKAKHKFEPTGSRRVGCWYDLANDRKILAEDIDTGGFWMASGDYMGYSSFSPIADFVHHAYCDDDNNYGVGWIVHS